MGKKKEVAAPTTFEVRRNILQWFFDLNKKGGASKGMQDLCGRIDGSRMTAAIRHLW